MMKVILFIGSVMLFTGHTQASVKIIPELDKLYVYKSAPLTLECVYEFPSSEGDGEPVTFYKESEMMPASNRLGFNVTEKRKIAGPTTTVTMSMMKEKTVQTDRGVYECKLGVSTTYANITVEIFSVVGTNDTLVKDAKTATLGCTVTGVGSGVDLQMAWKHNNKYLTNGDKYQINATTGILEIINPVSEDMGAYYCELTFDPTSARNSQQVTPKAVVLLASPMIDKSDNTKNMVQGDELELKCKVSGYPAPTIKWLKDDMPVNETNRIYFLEYAGNAKGTIQFTELMFVDEAIYTCFAFNEVSPFNATAEFQVRVRASTLQRDIILVSVFATIGVVWFIVAIVGFICYRKRTTLDMSSYTENANSGAQNKSAQDITIYKRVLDKQLKVLIEDLNQDEMLDHLTTKEVLSTVEIKDLRNPHTKPSDNKRQLIEKIKMKGEGAYRALLEGLKANKQEHLYKLLETTERELKQEREYDPVAETYKKTEGSGARSFGKNDGENDPIVGSLRQPDSTSCNN